MAISIAHPLLPTHAERSSVGASVVGWSLFVVLLSAALLLLPVGFPRPKPSTSLLTLGVVGTWRWSWAALNLARAVIYKRLVFPRIRKRANAAVKPPALYVLVTSYRMPQALNAAVYGRLFDELARYGVPTFVVACVTDQADAALIQRRFALRDLPNGTCVRIVAQRGRGKRDAMAEALTSMAAERPPPGSLVVLMDGDTLLAPGSLERTCAVLACSPKVGAVTTDNVPLVHGNAFTREWYRVRMAHRDTLMASMSLSRKLLVLTGRFSIFRSDLAMSHTFIGAIGRDHVDHRRLGRIDMLTGDDKSSWFETLSRGWEMLYVPDVAVHPVEDLPNGGFLRASTALMVRWYGNMVRNNGRALRLGPTRCGAFLWVSLLDQRYSMWTSLLGPSSAIILALTRHTYALFIYLAWVLLSRSIVCMIYWIATGRFHPLFILTLYYNQVMGSAIKIYAVFHPDRQKWTRQAGGLAGAGLRGSFATALSTPLMLMTVCGFVLLTAIFVGTLDIGGRRLHAPSVNPLTWSAPRPTHFVRPTAW